MPTTRNRLRVNDAPMRLLILIGAPAFLRVLGAWIDAGANPLAFWSQALLIAGATTLVSAGAWWLVLPRIQRRTGISSTWRSAQQLAYLITILGLLLLAGLLWIDTRQTLAAGAASLTRTVITLGAAWVLLTGVVLQTMHLAPARDWGMHRLSLPELNVILQLSVAAFLLLPANPPRGTTAWLAPVLVTGVVLFAGQIALQMLRRPGAAVMIFAAVIFYRALANFVLAQMPDAAPVGAAVHFLALAPAGALDMAYAVRLTDADARRTLYFALAAGVSASLAAALIFWPQLPGVPPLTPESVLLVVGLGAPVGIGFGWCGATFGRAARFAPRRSSPPA
jgi:hypothetical protein